MAFLVVFIAKALAIMEQKIKDYNECIKKQTRSVYYRFACTAAPVAIGLAKVATGQSDIDIFSAASLASGAGSVIGFIRFNRKPEIDIKNEPAAMFHEANKAMKGSQNWLSRLNQFRLFKKK